ncbi:hypothetical protein [Acetobacter sp. UBA5411]|uniref:hypothetical protein n=1 Tax=Acetobacter sp. UBA5411 TaxID=1945905 RepID=UPI0025C3003B|nr:hypothetical protein [Acetobacter sp. UBA5411]
MSRRKKIPKPLIDSKTKPLPPVKVALEERFWAFSLRYFKQIKHFGISQEEKSWFASLLTCLSKLSSEKVEDLINEREKKDAWRFHPINWGAKNIPISLQKLDWVPPEYINNQDEYKIFQFQISTGKGRVVGFFDENWIFNIILLDPKHNIQPSGRFGYAINKTHILEDNYSMLLSRINYAMSTSTCTSSCTFKSTISEIYNSDKHMIYINIDSDELAKSEKLIKDGHASCHLDIYQYGVLYLSSQKEEQKFSNDNSNAD